MDLPDESQWDETTCKMAVCQHPQCWATIRRVERGHPRILGSPCKTAPNNEDKSPVLTIVNISDVCFPTRGLACGHLSGFTFTRAPTLLCKGSKFDSKFQDRPRKALPAKDLTHCTDRSPKLSVLNLNETQLPSSQDARNMVVVWIPEQPEKHVRPAEKRTVSRQDGQVSRAANDHFLNGKQNTETQLGPPRMTVPPPSPVHLFKQLTSRFIPFWNQFDMEPIPQHLLKDLLPDEGKSRPSLEMKKKLPLEKSRPDSAISAEMFLSVHRLTLHRPALRYPKHLKKLSSNLNTEGRFSGALGSSGHQKRQRQQKQQRRMVKTPPERQEAKKKPKSNPGSPAVLHKCSGCRTPPDWKSDKKQPQWMKLEDPTLKQDSTERPQMENYSDSFLSKDDPELSKTKPSNKDISTQEVIVLESRERSLGDLSDSTSRIRWNPELKLLRILQATDDEDEGNQLSTSEGEGSFKTSQGSLTPEPGP
ncbi:uncharacterized protein C9orf43 homolog isoform X2 [Crocuta crocuta]